MNVLERIINAVRGSTTARPATGVLSGRHRGQPWRDYPADGLTPQRLLSIFREADTGALSSQMALFEQMEERDAHLYSVANTRRLAITGLPWEVISAAEMPGWGVGRHANSPDKRLADEAAAHCDAALRDCGSFDSALAHMALALGRNISVVELVWEANRDGLAIVDFIPIDFERLMFDRNGELRILTDDSQFEGIALPPNKFIVHIPHPRSAHPMRGGLSRVTSIAYLAKHFAIKDWLVFAEVFGMPVRIARYQPTATEKEKRELLTMLRQLGADATGIFSKAVEVEIMQTRLPGETNLYENIAHYFDREMSKAWLGQTLTTDTLRTRASAGAAAVHDRVRRDLRDDDLRREANTIRRDVLTPLTRFQFGANAPVPFFRRIPDQSLDPHSLAQVLSVAVNDLGARIPATWAHASLGLPQAQEGESTLDGRPITANAER